MTIQSAYALFRETEVGSLEPGKYADLIVVSDNPLTVPASELRRLSVLATMVGGRYEFCNPRNADLCPGYQARTPLPLPDLRPPVAVRWLLLGLVVALPLGAGLGLRRPDARRWLVRAGAVAAVLGGALWTWMWVWGSQSSDNDPTWAGLGAGLLLALAVVGLAGAQRPTRFGWLGLVLAGLGPLAIANGLLLSSWFQWEAGWLGLIIGVLSHVIGLTLLGLANLLAKRRSFLLVWPLAMGVLGGLLPFALSFANNNADWPALIMAYGLGGGWALLGLALWRAKPAVAPA